ncbi:MULTISPECIES: GNAT family N-acetyltransferase [unclassified Desulfovibrio]|uniref:GNAT family N-acetyltransferase n=1 Tax=unclassified Desulfovibrio TaxID=2593640 RepID=UPI0013EA2380|nr:MULTISPECIES: GNAT family N-acetyltransferase [unclassified Desulfovibrio]
MKLLFDLLAPNMDRGGFTCGEPVLDAYLHKQAGQDMRRGYATVIAARQATSPEKVVGFYTLSAASILLTSLPNETARKMPRYPAVPAIRLGRLAVETSQQGQHIGSLLVLDALRRACRNELAWAVFLVDAKSKRAAVFYEKFLFQRFHENPLALWMLRKNAEIIIKQS